MIEQIKEHIELLFEDAPKTRKAFELKEEIIANAVERYADLVNDGVNEEDAYKNVINSIGNVKELFKGLDEPVVDAYKRQDQYRKRSAIIVSVAVGIYIIAGLVLIGTDIFFPGSDEIGLLIAIGICIIPTCMLVYNAMAFPAYKKKEDTVVEDFKKFNSDSKKRKAVRSGISSVIWTLTLVFYFIVSFVTYAWYITWVMFIIAACIEAIVSLVFRVKELNE